jgi:hypothetical protein
LNDRNPQPQGSGFHRWCIERAPSSGWTVRLGHHACHAVFYCERFQHGHGEIGGSQENDLQIMFHVIILLPFPEKYGKY